MNSSHPTSTVSDTSEQILLFRIRKYRDEKAFERLVVEHRESLYRFLRAKLPTNEDAKDASNAAFFRVWNYITTAHEKETHHFRGLLFHVARNLVADFYRVRKDAFSIEAMGDAGLEIADTKQTPGRIEAETDARLMREAIAKLKPEYQDVIILRHFDGLDTEDIARKLEKTENNIRVTLHRALRELRKHL